MKRTSKAVLGVILAAGLVSQAGERSPRGTEVPPDYLSALPKEAQKILMSGEKFVLYSLDPQPVGRKAREEVFHDFRVLGKTPVSDARQKMTLVNTLENGIANGTSIARCFNPRHGIRSTKGTNSVDLVICFECGQAYGYSSKGTWKVATTVEPESLFNEVLKKSGVPLPEPRTKTE